MKTTLSAISIAVALAARLISAQAEAAEMYDSGTDPHSVVGTSGLHNPNNSGDRTTGLHNPYNSADRYAGPDGFSLPGWAQLKGPIE